jgi:aspartyl-tRNA synthetase
MVAGCDKYMQIVRCFRDEDPRADRQAEFTQLDVEMAFIDRENIIAIIEPMLRRMWKEILGIEIPNPIPHMEYDEAMNKYGSDRPDLRFAMPLADITALAHSTDFGVFKNAPMVKAICVPGGSKLTRKDTDALADWAKGFGAKGLAVTKVTAGGFDTGVAKFILPIAAKLIEATGAKEGDLLCFAADKPRIVHKVLGELRLKMARDMNMKPSMPFAWVWVMNFPLFEWDEDEKRFVSTHHPFTAPLDEDLAKLDSRDREVVESVKSKAYDIVCNGSELGGGSIRIHRMDVQAKVFSLLGIDPEAQKQKFGFLLDALQYGAPPHGGIALGLDRLIMILRGTTNIRDVIAFPKTQSGADLMCGSPSPVDERQLKDVHIRVIQPPAKA